MAARRHIVIRRRWERSDTDSEQASSFGAAPRRAQCRMGGYFLSTIGDWLRGGFASV